MQATMVGISLGVATAGAGALIGVLVGVACTPSHFAMPSLMADLGTIEPSFNALIAAVLIGLTLVAIALGMAPQRGGCIDALSRALSRRRDGDNPVHSPSIGDEDLS